MGTGEDVNTAGRLRIDKETHEGTPVDVALCPHGLPLAWRCPTCEPMTPAEAETLGGVLGRIGELKAGPIVNADGSQTWIFEARGGDDDAE